MSRHRWPGGKAVADDFLTADACLNGCGSMRRYVEVPPKLPGKPWTSLREEYSLDGGKTWSVFKRVPPCVSPGSRP